MVTELEAVLNAKVSEAKTRIEEVQAEINDGPLIPDAAQMDRYNEVKFLRGYVAGVNHAIRRVREGAPKDV